MPPLYTFRTYPDEELGSIIIRAYREVGLSPSEFVRWYLNGTSEAPLSSVTNLVVPVASITDMSPRQLLSAHTLVPYGMAALPPTVSHRIAINLICGRLLHDSPTIGKIARRWCDACVRTDLATYGIAYWHRGHLLPGISTCHLHGNPLLHLPETSRSIPIHEGVTHWIRADLPQDLIGVPLNLPTPPSLQHQISLYSVRALKGRRALPLAELPTNQLRQVFGPALLRYAGCDRKQDEKRPLTTARILSIVAMRYLEKFRAGSQLEILF
jgi:hypothetical protein